MANGALASTIGRPNADMTITDVKKTAISWQGVELPEPSPYLRDMTVGNGAAR